MDQLKINRPLVLIIEAEGKQADELANQLDGEGYETTIARNQDDGVWQAHRLCPDLIILDMPFADRLALCRQLCDGEVTREIPILILAARDEPSVAPVGFVLARHAEQVIKLSAGDTLWPRLGALHSGRTQAAEQPQVVEYRGLRIDLFQHQAYTNGTRLNLTPTEFRLLECFLRQPGRAFSRSQLMEFAMGKEIPVLERTIDGHVKSLRRKLNSDRQVIQTVRGIGYRLRDTRD
jgi:two-component system phosphate regulon response regulator PhoB